MRVGDGVIARRVKNYNFMTKGSMTNKHQVYIEEWKSLPWKDFEKILFRLQHRLYKVSKEKDLRKIKNLQSLILGSASSRYLAVRQVTQVNMGTETAGIDGQSWLTHKKRLELVDELKLINTWKHQPLRRVYIPNSKGKSLGIPTLKDRAMQCLLKYALEPYYESIASERSQGFIPGRCRHDVQKIIFINLKSDANGHEKSILKLDIEKCFDKINHNKLMSFIILPKVAMRVIHSALKAGVMNERIKSPQGGFISPLLCNVALNGIEDLHNQIRGSQSKQLGIRYADDLIFFLKSKENATILLNKIKIFLEERGLQINEAKTQLIQSMEGFDFLGWHCKVKLKNHKFVCHPSKENRKKLMDKIKFTMRDSRLPIAERLSKIKVIYRGWRNYHQYSDMSQVYTWGISNWVYRFCRKRTSIDKINLLERMKNIFNGHTYKANNYINVRYDKSPFDGDWIYWTKRQNLRYTTLSSKVAK